MTINKYKRDVDRKTSFAEHIVMWFTRLCVWLTEYYRVRGAKRLYKRLWKLNDILLNERHGYHKKDNKQFHDELSKCTDVIEGCICKVRDTYDP